MRKFTIVAILGLIAKATAQGLVAALQADADLSTLLGAIQAVPGLAETLDAAQGITVFAPTNDAFANVDAASPEGTAIASGDVPGIASILSYHVVPATIVSTDITETPAFVQTLLTPGNTIGGGVATLVPGGQYLGAQLNNSNVIIRSGNLATSTVTQAVRVSCLEVWLSGYTNSCVDRTSRLAVQRFTRSTPF